MSSQEDHDTLIRIETKLDRALKDVSTIEGRVSVLEKAYLKIGGGIAVVVILGDIAIKWFFK